ncbi:thioredoxin family protein [Nocardia thailandica]|uniref:Thioredoxin family protein n=1 Tax=Nocardia thailandica TaxID=257275 RepID=A0ABW6PLP0_9NOCA|nr:thioredoxin family protein [Nocardia thailandica]
MALESLMVPLGTAAPDFALPDLDGVVHTRAGFRDGPGLLVFFSCNHCPYVRHLESALGSVLSELPIPAVAICTNDAEGYPDDAPDRLRAQAERAGWRFPYLLDTTQRTGRDFGAVCTPDFFLYDADLRLAYRGAFDESTPRNGVPVTGDLLRSAVDLVLRGRPVPEPHRPSMGCSIKWRED